MVRTRVFQISEFSSFGDDTVDFAHWVPLSQNWNLQYETLSVSDLESYRFFILKMLKLYMPGYADMWNWSWSVHSELLHIKNMKYNAHDVFHWLHSKIGMPIKTPLVDLLSINLLTCFDRKSSSACYQNEDVKESSQSIKVVISLASNCVLVQSKRKSFWGWTGMLYILKFLIVGCALRVRDLTWCGFGSKKQCPLDFIMVRVTPVSLEVASSS